MAITINGTGTVTGLSAGGLNDGAIAKSDLADSVKPVFIGYALLEDQKSSGTDGGTATSGSWFTRTLNTTVTNPNSIVTDLSSNQFTLGAGNYLIKWTSPHYGTDGATSRLYDVTNSAVIGNGASCYPKSHGAETTCQGAARATPSGSTVYRIEARVQTTENTYGCGVATSSFGKTEVYTQVEIYKESS